MIRRYKLLKLTYDRLSLRERVMVLLASCGSLFFLWHLVFYSSQISWFDKIEAQKEQELKQTKTFLAKRDAIIKKLEIPETHQKIGKHGELLKKLQLLNLEVGKFKHEFVSPKELSLMMHAMLKDISGVRLIEFESLVEADEQKVKNTSVSHSKEVVSKSNLLRNRYRLVIDGNYFAVLEYLKRLEAIEWRLYWDKFDYRVIRYPNARVLIDFYTLANRDDL